jgi:hypothetical protein
MRIPIGLLFFSMTLLVLFSVRKKESPTGIGVDFQIRSIVVRLKP